MSQQLAWNEGYDRRVEMLAGGLLTLPAVLSFALILHHPTLHDVHGLANVAARLRVTARLDGIVHGGLMLMYALQALGYFLFTSSLGWKRPAAAAGLMAYAAAVLLLTIPATLDGFVTSNLATACLASPGGCGSADIGAFRLVAILIQDFTKVALVVTAAATLCWSISLSGKERLGGITKQGDRYLRQLLVIGALSVVRYAERNGTRRPWLVQLLARRTTKVATVALANKTARMAWATMTSGESYREPVVQAAA